MKGSKRTWRWVSLDGTTIEIHRGRERPVQARSYFDGRTFFCSADYDQVCGKGFKSVTGLTIKPGTCVKVDFKCKILKDHKPRSKKR